MTRLYHQVTRTKSPAEEQIGLLQGQLKAIREENKAIKTALAMMIRSNPAVLKKPIDAQVYREFRDLWIESLVFICYPFPLVLTCVHEPIELNPEMTLATRNTLVVLLYNHFDAYYIGI